jgi:hypothetical protein
LFLSRAVESVLRPFDHEGNELVVRWRIWTQNWFPYRTAQFLGLNEDKTEMVLGPWEWNRPRRFKKTQ